MNLSSYFWQLLFDVFHLFLNIGTHGSGDNQLFNIHTPWSCYHIRLSFCLFLRPTFYFDLRARPWPATWSGFFAARWRPLFPPEGPVHQSAELVLFRSRSRRLILVRIASSLSLFIFTKSANSLSRSSIESVSHVLSLLISFKHFNVCLLIFITCRLRLM